MTDVLDLARADLRELKPYTPGAYEPDFVRMNANESPWRLPADSTDRGLNLYPPPRPAILRTRLAGHYGVDENRVLVTRGSSEAIDVLIRGFCEAGRDSIAICPPTFDMYRVYATIQGAGIVRVPLDHDNDFALDVDALVATADERTKIVFICSPNNPSGIAVPREQLERVCEAFAGRALVVIDEAYHEFSSGGSCLELCERYEHVVLLRTLSKFVALAGARCGIVIGAERLVHFLGNVLPPYTFPTPSIELVLEALSKDSLRVAKERISLIVSERERLARTLEDLPNVARVYPSDANFVLVETYDADRFESDARAANILVRRFRDDPALTGCVRVTVGRPRDNDRLLKAVAGMEVERES